MAWETGTWLSPSDGLDKIKTFLVAQGWTVDSFPVEAPGKRLHMHKGAFYLNAHSADDSSSSIWPAGVSPYPQIGFNVGTGYNAANSWRDQAGVVKDTSNAPMGAAVGLPAGPVVGYRFDYDDTYKSLVIFIQTTIGIWRWMGFGESLIKAGAWTGGAWITSSTSYYYGYVGSGIGHGTNPSYPFGANTDSQTGPLAFLRADVDAFTNKWISCSSSDWTGKIGGTNVAGRETVPTTIPSITNLVDRARNSLNSLSPLLPVQIYAARDAGGMSLLGTLPNIHATNISGMVIGQSYQQGVDWFTPFPGDVATRGTVIRRT